MIRRLHTEEKRKTEQTTKNKQANKKANKKPISLAVFSVKKKIAYEKTHLSLKITKDTEGR